MVKASHFDHKSETFRKHQWSCENVRVKVAVFFNMMEETDQLGLEPIVKLIRDKTKV